MKKSNYQSNDNAFIIEQLTTSLSKVTYENFDAHLKKEEHYNLVVKEECKDMFGRTSRFKVKFGEKFIPLFQPATIMFRSAIQSFHKLAIVKTNKDGN